MDAHFPPAIPNKHRRRGLFDPLSDLFPPASTKDSVTSTGSSTDVLPTSSTTSGTTTPTSSSSSTSVTSSTTSSSTTSSTTSTSSTSQFVPSTLTVTPSSIITVTQTPTLSSTSTSDAPTSTVVNATTQPQGFLQNKVLSGIVFAFVGMVGLVVLVSIATFALRRSRKKRLINEALSFDPADMESNEEMIIEKGRRPVRDRTSSSTGNTTVYGNDQPPGYHNGYGVAYATATVPYAAPQVPYAFGSNQHINTSNIYTHQPYTQQFDWTGAPLIQENQQGYAPDPNPEEPGAPQHGNPRRSQSSSSGDFQFAAVTPPPGIPGARR